MLENRTKIIYLRVSKKNLKKNNKALQDIKTQLPIITDKFNLDINGCIIIEDKGTAYDKTKFKNRVGFIEILNYIVGNNNILSLFTGKYEKTNIELYIFDYNRLFRNIVFGLLFGCLCELFGCNVYSCNQEDLNAKENEEIGHKIGRYVRLAMYSFLAEGYSRNISDNVKKSFKKSNGITYSKDNKRIGWYFKNIKGEREFLKKEKLEEIYKFMKKEIIKYEKHKCRNYYNYIIKDIKNKWGIIINKSTLTRHKKKIKLS